ncbi:MAG: response regulator [Dehalococcoidales bacterium]|nr:response regulator [Dehalococcoidales bacterium]
MVISCESKIVTKTRQRFFFLGKDGPLLDFVKDSLTPLGFYLAASLCDCSELKTALKELQPDFVILDIEPPAMNGIDIALRLRRSCDIPIILLTCWKTDENEVRGLDAHRPDYLTEPFGKETLIEWVNSAFPDYRAGF